MGLGDHLGLTGRVTYPECFGRGLVPAIPVASMYLTPLTTGSTLLFQCFKNKIITVADRRLRSPEKYVKFEEIKT